MVKKRYRLLIAFALFFVSASNSFCEIFWNSDRIKLYPNFSDTVSTTQFDFKNIGNHAIRILRVEPSCGCVNALINKRVFLAGEKGAIYVSYTIGKQIGIHRADILVETDEVKRPYYRLFIIVNIPRVIVSSGLPVLFFKYHRDNL